MTTISGVARNAVRKSAPPREIDAAYPQNDPNNERQRDHDRNHQHYADDPQKRAEVR